MAAQPSSPDPLSLIEAQLQDLQAALVASDALNFEQGAQALQNAGYATDPQYARKLTSMIQQLKSMSDKVSNAYRNDIENHNTWLPFHFLPGNA